MILQMLKGLNIGGERKVRETSRWAELR
jgi:hypothetical protein